MELIDIIPEFNLYEEYWKIYTKSDIIPPQFISGEANIERSIIGEGSEIYGDVINSVVGAGVTIGKGAVVKDSIVMQGASIGEGAKIEKSIVAENVVIGAGVETGVGEYAPSAYDPKVYQFDLVTIGENSVIPAGVRSARTQPLRGRPPRTTILTDYWQAAITL